MKIIWQNNINQCTSDIIWRFFLKKERIMDESRLPCKWPEGVRDHDVLGKFYVDPPLILVGCILFRCCTLQKGRSVLTGLQVVLQCLSMRKMCSRALDRKLLLNLTKLLTNNHFETIYRSVRTECSSVVRRGGLTGARILSWLHMHCKKGCSLSPHLLP